MVLSVVYCLTSIVCSAQTTVSGGIYANTTWTKVNSPYIVTDTVVVFPGVTLTIEPGVTVKFNDNKRLEIRQAKLVAIGTAVDSITFTSNSGSPMPGIWESVYLNSDIQARFNYCNFNYANYGIDNSSGNVSFNNSVFSHNNIGCGASNGHSNISIDSCSFIYNIQAGLSSMNASVITNSSFQHNKIGIHDNFGDYNQYINCNISYDSVGMAGLMTSEVNNCIVTHNYCGIYCDAQCAITNCMIDSNSIIGIGAEHDTITNCIITHNGVGLEMVYEGVISQNIIENNVTGIHLRYAPNSIYCNKICNNSAYNISYNAYSGDNDVFANNYWCTTDSLLIAPTIYDGYDNITYGLVSILPLDTGQCYLNGCNLSITSTVINATCDTCHTGSAVAHIAYGSLPIVYTWNSAPLQNTQTATHLAPGTYTICAADANGCTACNNVFVDSSNCTGFSVSAQATNATCSTCPDGIAHVNVTGGAAPYSYIWYTAPLQNTAIATGLPQGSYAICVNDAHGCAACDSVVVSVGSCSAHFNLYPDTVPHNYTAVNMASGVAPLTYLWNWGDGTTSTGAFPSHTYASAGLYSIYLSIIDAVGCTNNYCNTFYLMRTTNTMVYVNVVAGIGTGISSPNSSPAFSISPNPGINSITITIDETMLGSTLTIYDITGKKMTTAQLSTVNRQLSTENFASGIYFVTLENEKGRTTKKLVIEK